MFNYRFSGSSAKATTIVQPPSSSMMKSMQKTTVTKAPVIYGDSGGSVTATPAEFSTPTASKPTTTSTSTKLPVISPMMRPAAKPVITVAIPGSTTPAPVFPSKGTPVSLEPGTRKPPVPAAIPQTSTTGSDGSGGGSVVTYTDPVVVADTTMLDASTVDASGGTGSGGDVGGGAAEQVVPVLPPAESFFKRHSTFIMLGVATVVGGVLLTTVFKRK